MTDYDKPSSTCNTTPMRLTRLTRRQLLVALGGMAGSALLAACSSAAPALVEAAPAGAASTSASVLEPPTVSVPVTSTVTPIVTPTPGTAGAEVGQAAAFAQQSIDLVNQARIQAGLPALTANPLLMQVAMAYSQRMAAEDFYGHEDPQGDDVADRFADAGYLAQISAENIARGQPDAATVVEGWLNSPDHRANIMDPDLREIGAGYAYTETAPYHHYWTHVFGTPDASVGRDRNQYPAQALAQINALRQQAGVAPVTLDANLSNIATEKLRAMVEAESYDEQVPRLLDEASQAALQRFTQAVALSSAGAATPEVVVEQWSSAGDSNPLLDPAYTAATVAYTFLEQEEFRHYWLLLLAG